MNMKQRLTALQMKISAIEKAGMIEKPARAQDALNEATVLMEQVINQVELIGQSYNGLLAYINQIDSDPMAVAELNAKLKAGGYGLYSDGGNHG